MIKKLIIIVMLCSTLVFVSGCWSNNRIEEMTFATALDLTEEKMVK